MNTKSYITKPNSSHRPGMIVMAVIIAVLLIGTALVSAGPARSFEEALYLVDGIVCKIMPDTDYCTGAGGIVLPEKPVIYLYPETTTDVTVQLDYQGALIADYPPYDPVLRGWRVTAQPDGHLTNHADGREYSYLFWEGQSAEPVDWDLSTGFVVKGIDTRAFLQETLAEIGLTPKEYNEFIVYWYPKMKDNPYNLIHFAGTEYTDTAPLTITPAPDSVLRVFMVYKPLTHPVEVTPQTFIPFTRTGFTVVEWGGTEVR